jgi:hypothetical protein
MLITLKNLFETIFGSKLPCGHMRTWKRFGRPVTCRFCGKVYRKVKYNKSKPLRAGGIVYYTVPEQSNG